MLTLLQGVAGRDGAASIPGLKLWNTRNSELVYMLGKLTTIFFHWTME